MKEALFQMYESITTQAEEITTQANREDFPRENKHTSTMASRVIDFKRMNPLMFFGSKLTNTPMI